MELYKNIKARRKELGLSQDDLAARLGYKSKTSISKIEKGYNDIPQSKIVEFAKALNTTPGKLMGINEKNVAAESKPLSAKELMQTLCQGDKEALAIVERLTLTEDGRLQITGADLASQAVLDHQVKGLISALKNAKLAEDGLLHFEFTPDRKE